MKTAIKRILRVAKDAGRGWSQHKAPRMGAALAYYTAFSIGPLLLIAIAIAGLVFGREAAAGEVFNTLQGLIGSSGASVVQKAIEGASKQGATIWASILGVITLLIGASGVFAELHQALNDVWSVQLEKKGIWTTLRKRFFSLTMVLGVGFLLLVSLLLTTALGVVGRWLSHTLPGGEALWQVINFAISLGIVSLLFALLFKYVPDIKIGWREVLYAGVLTSLLFTIGKTLLGLYIGKGKVGSAYGAAGSLIVLLLWVYYSAQILYFGAELSRALAATWHARVEPARMAESVSSHVATPVEKKEEKETQKKKKETGVGPHPPWPKPT